MAEIARLATTGVDTAYLPMPYQVKAGTFLVVEASLAAALKRYDSLKDQSDEVVIRDMEGRNLDIEELRPILNKGESS